MTNYIAIAFFKACLVIEIIQTLLNCLAAKNFQCDSDIQIASTFVNWLNWGDFLCSFNDMQID